MEFIKERLSQGENPNQGIACIESRIFQVEEILDLYLKANQIDEILLKSDKLDKPNRNQLDSLIKRTERTQIYKDLTGE